MPPINEQVKILESGAYTYIAYAPPGTPEAINGWKLKRVGSDGVKYANGNANYENAATDSAMTGATFVFNN